MSLKAGKSMPYRGGRKGMPYRGRKEVHAQIRCLSPFPPLGDVHSRPSIKPSTVKWGWEKPYE